VISGDPGFVTIPSQVTIPANQLSANFTIDTTSFPIPFSDHVTEIYAAYVTDVKSAALTITPKVVVGIINRLVLSPPIVKGGGVSIGYVILERAVETDTVVALAALETGGSSIPEVDGPSSLVYVPPSVTVPAGQISAIFRINTEPPGMATRTATIIAAAVATKYAMLTITK
jgi:hypothetical protein